MVDQAGHFVKSWASLVKKKTFDAEETLKNEKETLKDKLFSLPHMFSNVGKSIHSGKNGQKDSKSITTVV